MKGIADCSRKAGNRRPVAHCCYVSVPPCSLTLSSGKGTK